MCSNDGEKPPRRRGLVVVLSNNNIDHRDSRFQDDSKVTVLHTQVVKPLPTAMFEDSACKITLEQH